MVQAKNRIGETRIMNCGKLATIVEYNDYINVMVKFNHNDELAKCRYAEFKNGEVKSHFSPTVYEVGIVGYETTTINGKKIKSYSCWKSMIQRCYSEKYKEKHPTYKDVTCCEEWKYYKNFKEWYNENYYEVNDERMEIDKDILHKGNKIYSPETCCIVPHKINELFVKSDKRRGNLPIGILSYKNKFRVQCNLGEKKKQKHLGVYDTIEEAFEVYKKYKIAFIKEMAESYKNKIPIKLYKAMLNWQVEITD